MNNELITILSLIIGILGLIASFIGTYLTYIFYVNPISRFNKYLKNPKNWEKFQGIENHLTVYRHKKYPNFQIVIDWDKELVRNFHDEWINQSLYPDKTNNTSYYIRLEANAMLVDKELFVSLDGHRYFMPVPKFLIDNNNERTYYYDKRQVQLAKIVGKHYLEKGIYEFVKECKKPILIKE